MNEEQQLRVTCEDGTVRVLFPVAKVRVQTRGGNAGIAWYASSLNPYDSLPLLHDGTILYVEEKK